MRKTLPSQMPETREIEESIDDTECRIEGTIRRVQEKEGKLQDVQEEEEEEVQEEEEKKMSKKKKPTKERVIKTNKEGERCWK
jgi:hypothetical protein